VSIRSEYSKIEDWSGYGVGLVFYMD